MSEKTVTTYICDRCGEESNNIDFSNGSESGYSRITYKGSLGSRGYDGAWGGMSFDEKVLLCRKCTVSFREFLKDE